VHHARYLQRLPIVKAQYIIRTRDVYGSTCRAYRTLAGAVKRFEEMVGYSVDVVIAEMFYGLQSLPEIDELLRLRGLSCYGTEVTFEKVVVRKPQEPLSRARA